MNKVTVQEIVTNRIIERIKESNVLPWEKSWVQTNPTSLSSGKPYNGINHYILSSFEFSSAYWGTYNQIKKLGGYVKKGESGVPVVFWKILKKKDNDGNEDTIPLLRYSTVFNLDQTDGISDDKYKELDKKVEDFKNNFKLEEMINQDTAPEIIHSSTYNPCYYPGTDVIHTNLKENFESEDAYYSTAFHEISHSTGHKTRLNRKGITSTDKNKIDYAQEEVIAEISASMVCSMTGIENEKEFERNISYVKTWLSRFENDRRLLMNLISQGTKSANFILNNGKTNYSKEK